MCYGDTMETLYFIILAFVSGLQSAAGACPRFCKQGLTCDAEDSGCSQCERQYYGRYCQYRAECTFTSKGTDYRGLRNTTASGITCQRWSLQSPHKHDKVGEENYCRNPDSDRRPWCYTIDPKIRWGYCEISSCSDMCPAPSLDSGADLYNPPSDGFVVGYSATIGCITGFESDETPATVNVACQENKTWTQSPLPKCKMIICQKPTLNNGSILNSTSKPIYQYNDNITFVCDEGYTPQAEVESSCQADKTWRPLPKCTINECGQPQIKPNSRIISNITYQYGDVATFECDTGYIMHGPTQLTCQANKTWNVEPPTCKIAQCDLPLLQSMMKLQNPKHNYSYGDIIKFTCIEGYEFHDGNIAFCEATEQWSEPFPACQINECGQPQMNPNSRIISNITYQYGDVATFECDTGYIMHGPTQLTCQANKTWNVEPPTCKRYEFHSGNIAFCKATRQWREPFPACQISECGHLELKPNSRIISNITYQYGDVVRFECETGYTMQGPTHLTCQANKTWSMEPPTCKVVECEFPSLRETSILQNPKEHYSYGDIIKIFCIKGYDFHGGNIAVCNATGQWSEPFPVCQLSECGHLELKPNSRIISNITYQYGDVVRFECETGYTMQGPTHLTCQANKTWSMEPPTCKVVECEFPSLRETSILQNNKEHYTYGDIIKIFCIKGYDFHGGNIAVCNATGQWSEPFPVCQKIVKRFSTIIWIGITIAVSLITALGSTCVTVLIMLRCRPIDKRNKKKEAIAMNKMHAPFNYDITNTDIDGIYNQQ